MTDNLALWNSLKKTDPKATKAFTKAGGFRGTQIDPTWRLQMMTEAFGPVGKGWGWQQVEWTVVEQMVFICCKVWYVDPESGEKCWTGEQWGGTEIVTRRRDGSESRTDEAFKMSITDAIGKCCLQIGLAADVYMGQFDDSKYRAEVDAEYRAKENGTGSSAGSEHRTPNAKAAGSSPAPSANGNGNGGTLTAEQWVERSKDHVAALDWEDRKAWVAKNRADLDRLKAEHPALHEELHRVINGKADNTVLGAA